MKNNLYYSALSLIPKMKKVTLIVVTFFFVKSVSAQDIKYCGQVEAEERIKIENPQFYQQVLRDKEDLENYTKAYAAQKSNERGPVYIIPVVFHIIHNYGPENISDEQVYDAVRIINEDYRKQNDDTSSIVAAFRAIAGDAEIEFRLAQKDPQGNCTNGIVRKSSLETYKGANYFSNKSTSNLSRWPRNKYLNIWVVHTIDNGLAGYTYVPGTVDNAPNMDGIMILYNYVGSIGTGSYARSRTLTHEIGHWLNLAHPWGDSNTPGVLGNCNIDDGVADTPNTIGWTSCNLAGTTCNSLDNVQNYMEYSYCSRMFTKGQGTRMRAAVTSSTAQRNSLWQTSNLIATGTDGGKNLCQAGFIADKTEICSGQSIDFIDKSYNNPLAWNWTFQGGTPSVSSDKNPSVVYNIAGKYNVQLAVSDGLSQVNKVINHYITVFPTKGQPSPFIEDFESTASFPNGNWFINNTGVGASWELANVGVSGSKSVKINNGSSTGGFNEISSTIIDLSSLSGVHVSFKVAFAQRNPDNNDDLKFFASRDCGETWFIRWSRSGSNLATVPAQSGNFVPDDTAQWVKYTITNLPASFLVNDFRLKFQFSGGGGNNIYIDDISIYDPAAVGINEQKQQTDTDNLKVYPNPFSEEAVISFSISNDKQVKLSISDLLGNELLILPATHLLPGKHHYKINTSDIYLSKGIYFIKLSQGDKVTVKKIILN